MGSVGPCPRAPSGGSRAQLRHRERGAEIVSAPSRYSGRRAEGKGTGPDELSKDKRAGGRWVLNCERTGWAWGLYTGLFIECTRVGSCIFVVFRCSNPVICVLNVCRLCVSTCYTQELGGWGGPRLQCGAESSRRREIGLEQTHYGKQLPGRGSGPAGPAARRLGRKLPGLQEYLDV